MSQKLCLPFFILCTCALASAQQWHDPEVGQMYRHAGEYVAMGNYKDAIVTYKQAILLAPQNLVLYKALGKTYYLSSDYSDAEQTLTPLLQKPGADTECYLLLAESQAAQQETKRAHGTLKAGLARFPGSGMLYHGAGTIYDSEKKTHDALDEWLNGIEKDPAYPPNYYDAARCYMATDHVVWGLLYGEIYLDLPHDTTGDDGFKKMLFAAWKKMFDHIPAASAPQYGTATPAASTKSFTASISQVYTNLTPVISDGVTTENLVMVRTRFLVDWFAAFGDKYPFTLFKYQDYMLRNGKFEIYNEWLFGNAESELQYEAWNKFHEGDIARFLEWKAIHPLHPSAMDFYNDRDMDQN